MIRTGDILKTTTKKFHSGDPKLPTYHEKCKCPVETMREYTFRGEITKLYITTTKPCREAYRDILSR